MRATGTLHARRGLVRHPLQRLDDTVHQRVRLGILAVLAEADRADFTYLRRVLLTDGILTPGEPDVMSR
jgi:hypothetical protein